jgi:hypothetical protein
MKYQVVYLKPKKNKFSKQTATFLKIDDAIFWESHVKEEGCVNVEVVPIFAN